MGCSLVFLKYFLRLAAKAGLLVSLDSKSLLFPRRSKPPEGPPKKAEADVEQEHFFGKDLLHIHKNLQKGVAY